jgi:peptidoglycan/xylan/chitin deacetylase (PgdA/CDA1 family)
VQSLSSFEAALLRLLARGASGRGRSASLVVLIFHRVPATADPMLPFELPADEFARRLDLLQSVFRVLPLRDAVSALARGTLPDRAACITFDDGYANNLEVAAPLLSARGLPATVFVAPGFLNGGWMFNDRIIEALRVAPRDFDLAELGLGRHRLDTPGDRTRVAGELVLALKHLPPSDRMERAAELVRRAGGDAPASPMMTDAQVAALPAHGIEVGAHTVNHPILTSIDADEARREIVESRARLEAITGAPVTSFAYPNGLPHRDYARAHAGMVRDAGFSLALSTSWGAATRASDPLQLPRIAPWDASARRYAGRIIAGYRQRRFVTA